MTTKSVKRGRPSEVEVFLNVIKSTPKGQTVVVGNLGREAAPPFKSNASAAYRAKTIVAARKSAKVSVTREGDEFYLTLVGASK